MRVLYYILQWTWGIMMNIFGAIGCGIAYICKWPISKFRNSICITVPKNIGGLTLGMFIFVGAPNKYLCEHEYGHTIQNLWWGPLFLFVIGAPSFIRCQWRNWYLTYRYSKTRKRLKDYDSIWFEGQATKLGHLANCNQWSWL